MRCNKLRILCLAVLCSIFTNNHLQAKKSRGEGQKNSSSNFGNSLLYLSPLILWPLNEFAVYKDLYGGWLEYFSVVGQHRLAKQEKNKKMMEKNKLKEEDQDKIDAKERVAFYNNIRGLFKELRENMFEDNSEKLIDLLAVCQEKKYFEEVSEYLNDPNMHECYYSSVALIHVNNKLVKKIGEYFKFGALTNFKYVCDNKLLDKYFFVTYPVKSKDVNYLGLGIIPISYVDIELLKGHLPYSSALLEKHNKFNETLILNENGTLNDSMLLKGNKDASESAEFVELGYWDLNHVQAVAKGEKNLSYLLKYLDI